MAYVLRGAAVFRAHVILVNGKTERTVRVAARAVVSVRDEHREPLAEAIVDADDQLILIEAPARLVLVDVARGRAEGRLRVVLNEL